jgi:lysine-N-methylase
VSTAPTIPLRPRLADHVLPRLHRVGDESFVVLFHQLQGRSFKIGMPEWVLLSMCDGTRDHTGILLAAAREGAHIPDDVFHTFVKNLHDEAMWASDVPQNPTDEPVRTPTPPTRILDPLADYNFHCDGQGTCCFQYATIVFSDLEAARARVTLPLIEDGGSREEWVFTPRAGSTREGVCSVKHVHGACAYLNEDGLCGIHAVAGAKAKPVGCDLYPARFVDDGEAVRVAPLVECSCVLRSTDTRRGEPLVASSQQLRSDLAQEVHVEILPDFIALTGTRKIPRTELVTWSRRVMASPPNDLAAWLWTSADAIERLGELTHTKEQRLPIAPFRLWLHGLYVVLDRSHAEAAAWRSPEDLLLQAMDVVRETLSLLCEDVVLCEALCDAAAPSPERERFYLLAVAHAHQWVDERPLEVQLRNLAMRVVLARAITRFVRAKTLSGKMFEEPLALVEALCRGHGIHLDGISF